MKPSPRRRITDADVAKFEALHHELEENHGLISRALAALKASVDPVLAGYPWSYEHVELVMESPEYQAWRESAERILLNHADVAAMRRVAYSNDLSDTAKASIAVAVLKGNLGKAKATATRAGASAESAVDHSPSVDMVDEWLSDRYGDDDGDT